MTKNIIHIFLKENKVPHTKSYLKKLLRNNPNSQNMYGMKNILKKYGIETAGVAFADKQNSQLSFPCILHLYSNKFIVATDLCDETITYIDEGIKHTMPIPELIFARKYTAWQHYFGQQRGRHTYNRNNKSVMQSLCKYAQTY